MHDETRKVCVFFSSSELGHYWTLCWKRVAQAASCALYLAGDASHSALLTGIDVMKYAPIPGLEAAGRVLLDIWDAVQQVVVRTAKS